MAGTFSSTNHNTILVLSVVAFFVIVALRQGHKNVYPILLQMREGALVMGVTEKVRVVTVDMNSTDGIVTTTLDDVAVTSLPPMDSNHVESSTEIVVTLHHSHNKTKNDMATTTTTSTLMKEIPTSVTNGSLHVTPPRLILPPNQMEWIVERRNKRFDQWLNESLMDEETKQKHGHRRNSVVLNHAADKIEGPWLDFLVIGFAKCGTSTLMANLGQVAPMPVKDICTPPVDTLKLAYQDWPKEFINDDNRDTLVLRGSKCPRYIGTDLSFLQRYSQGLTKTKFIVGIRHPILWFQSFWRMLGGQDPYL
ncbi:hypothetical protein IV203_004641 [Nitzschia inconspicua]|uniref:Sulfotransferase n=1 Tax=Nitzschia inconspicua TaxID=303405 RepID=A0A9K3PPF9_9STRA|nr:hypothetical protein IV203_004641 [Nitzschia inconspicua]